VKVELSAEAHGQVLEIDAWWRENRSAAPDLFTEELDRVLLLLEARPNLGTPYDTGAKTVRRVLLRRSHYYLYFVERADMLHVVAVWSVYRGRGPKL
jgi:plasmid stabilization system protein ParE